jgi:hypothetical protein
MEDIFTMKKMIISMAMVALLAVFALALQQTGNLIVTVMSEEGQTLPGASIILSSNVLMGTRNVTTGANGKATFRNLPPGSYSIDVIMDGFQNYRQTGIEIRLAKTAKFDVQMKLGEAREVVEVVGTGPIVDTTSNTISTEYDFNTYINHLPNNRSYTGLAGLSAAVVNANNPSAAGGGDNANLYTLDGIRDMDPRTHTWSSQFNVDALADVSVITGGATAEYGQAMGMMLNMVTKSGSNDVTGLVRLEMSRSTWNDISDSNPNTTSDDTRLGINLDDWNYTAGGPLYPDVLWWYLGYTPNSSETAYTRYLDPMNPTVGVPAIRTYEGHFFNVKGTLQLSEDIKIAGFYREDPITINNTLSFDYFTGYLQPSSDQFQYQGGEGYMASLTYVVNPSMFVEAQWTKAEASLEVGDQGNDPDGRFTATGTTGPLFQGADGWYWGAGIYGYVSARNHQAYKGSMNYLLQTESIGDHDIKIGVEWLDNWTDVKNSLYPTNETIFTSVVSDVGFDNVQWLYRYTWEDRLPSVETHNKVWTIFLQDSMELTDNLTINAGVRTDVANLFDNQDNSIHSDGIFSALAPRLGFAYDMNGILLRGSVGRYYDLYTNYLIDDFTYFTTPETKYYWAPTDGVDGHNGWTLQGTSQRGNPDIQNTLDPNLHPSFMDEATLGIDYTFSDTLAVSVTGMFRDYKDFVSRQDLDGDHYYNWTNLNTSAYGGSSKRYWGGIFEISKRPTEDNLFLNASLTYQNSQGLTATENNLRTTWYSTPWNNDANIERFWGDIAGFNWFAKAQATYFFPNNWYLGLTANWQQGFAYSSTRTINYGGYSGLTDYPNGRADMERTANRFVVNLQVGVEQNIEVPIDIPFWDDTIQLGIYADIFNLFNTQIETAISTNLASSRYGQATAWLNGRNYLLGFRIEL